MAVANGYLEMPIAALLEAGRGQKTPVLAKYDEATDRIRLTGPEANPIFQAIQERSEEAKAFFRGPEPPDEWLDSKPIPLQRHNLCPIPIDTLQGWLGQMANAVADASETPVELAGLIGLAAIATTVAGRYSLLIEDGYFEPLNFWTMPAMEPSNRKSFVLDAMTQPLFEFERSQRELLASDVTESQVRHRATDKRIKALEDKAGKAKTEEDYQSLVSEILELQRNIEPPMVYPQLVCDDATPEAIGRFLKQHNERISFLSDEGGNIVSQMLGRYSGQSNLDPYLKSYSGSPLKVNRAGWSEPILLAHPLMTIGITPQPETVERIAGEKEMLNRGLLARFVLCLPDSKVGRRNLRPKPISESVARNYSDALHWLLSLPPGVDDTGKAVPSVIRLSPDAYRCWKQFQRDLERELAFDGRLGDSALKSWGGKAAGNVARMAALMHIAEVTPRIRPNEAELRLDTMQRAVGAMKVLVDHAIAVHDLARDSERSQAEIVLERIKANFAEWKDGVSIREIFEKVKGRAVFGKADDVRTAMKTLEEHGYVRRLERKNKSEKFEVHPAIANLA